MDIEFFKAEVAMAVPKVRNGIGGAVRVNGHGNVAGEHRRAGVLSNSKITSWFGVAPSLNLNRITIQWVLVQ